MDPKVPLDQWDQSSPKVLLDPRVRSGQYHPRPLVPMVPMVPMAQTAQSNPLARWNLWDPLARSHQLPWDPLARKDPGIR